MALRIQFVLLWGLTSNTIHAGFAWTPSLPVLERAPGPNELLSYPKDESSAAVNPPGFCWTPHDHAKTYRLDLAQGRGSTERVTSIGPLTSTVCPWPGKLAPGNYRWQVIYIGSDETPFGVSKTRHFQVPPGLPELPMPDVTRLKAKLAGVRPRLYLARNRLREIREAVARGSLSRWELFLDGADRAVAEPPYVEPTPYPDGHFDPGHWQLIFTQGKVGTAHLVRAALAYRVTGEKKYLDAARRWMMAIANWNPRGSTSQAQCDEASMPILERMSLAWDWIGDQLTPAERAKVLAVMAERGDQDLRVLEKQDFLSHPFSNHQGRTLAFLGTAGVAFLGDIPNAEKWLDYVLRCYLTSYPCWGGDDGGWSQGVSYWYAYVYWLTCYAEALREAADVDFLQRPFYHNTGYFAVYMHPPYARRGAFGDDDEPPGETEARLVDFLADSFRDPILKWYAQSIPLPVEATEWQGFHREWFLEDAVSVWREAARPAGLTPKPPGELDGSRHFPDIGWAAMHSALGDAKNDVWALFKASRFGSFSHSHGDQNTFQLNAYGRALLIDTGYYPWYDSPHDALWTRQTRAHNAILVNGRGQPPHTWAAGGRIEAFERHGPVTIVRGQAASAYNLPQPDRVARLWREHLAEPIPEMDPKVESFERTLVFVAVDAAPFLVVHDYVKTGAPTTFDWMLHALNRMETESQSGSIALRDGIARLAVRLVSTEPFEFSQTSEFAVLPEVIAPPGQVVSASQRLSKFPDQWHLSAHTRSPALEIKFLAVMVPYRDGGPLPEISVVESPNARSFRVNGTEVKAWWGPGNRGAIFTNGLNGSGRLVIKLRQERNREIVSQ